MITYEKLIAISVWVALAVVGLLCFSGVVKAEQAGITLSWDAAQYATAYHIHYGTSLDKMVYSVNAGNVTTYNVSQLNCGTKYYFNVTAHNEAGSTVPTNTVEGTTADCPLSPVIPDGWEQTGIVIAPIQ